VTLPFEAHDDPDIDSIWTWFEYQIAPFGESRARVLHGISSGSDTATQAVRAHEAQFIGFTRAVDGPCGNVSGGRNLCGASKPAESRPQGVPSMGRILLDERSQSGPMTATVAEPQGVAARRS